MKNIVTWMKNDLKKEKLAKLEASIGMKIN